MGLSFRCSCGHLNQVVKMTTERMAECSECGQSVYIARQRDTRGPRVIFIVAALFTATTVALVTILILAVISARNLNMQVEEAKREEEAKRAEMARRAEDTKREAGPNPFINRGDLVKQPAPAPVNGPKPEDAKPKDENKAPVPDLLPAPDSNPPGPKPGPMPEPKSESESPKLPPPPSPNPDPSKPNDPDKPLPREGVLQPAQVEPAGRYRLGETIDQEVIVTRRSQIRVAGTEIGQNGQYALVSKLVIVKMNRDGTFTAEQTIQSGRLIECDADVKAELTAALEKAKGMKFELSVKPNGEVTAISGIKDPVQVKAGMDGVGQSLRMWSLLDADAWKELAGIAFFQPEKPLKKGANWSKPVTHDWGEMGRWQGKTNYLVRGPIITQSPIERIDYGHMLRYSLPAAGAKATLPITLNKAEFSVIAANGAILYNTDSKRVRSAEENFRVRGQLLVSFAGTEVAVDMEETQHFKLNISDPEQRNLVGGKTLPK